VDSGRTLPSDLSRDLLDELLAFKRQFESATHILGEGFVHLDEHRRIVRFNGAAETMLGHSASAVIGTEFSELFHASNACDPFADAGPSAKSTELVLRDSRGAAFPVRARFMTLLHRDIVDGWLFAFSRKHGAEEIEQLKNELVSTVSHELKTPLAAIKAYTATLRQNPALYESHRDEFLAVVEEQADRLSRLVDDMLLVTRVESTQMLRRRVRVAVDRVIDDAVAEMEHNPATHPIERHTTGVEISGDPERLRDVFRNLLENAVKYSPDGGEIIVSARENGDSTFVEVRDRGVGIPDADLPYIFDRFYRVESEATAGVGGSGLGLYIVSALVRAHGGSIQVRSTPGEGSAFSMRFPLR
jgi:two-component system phosphate regulon sensor histidine kinase PhoR